MNQVLAVAKSDKIPLNFSTTVALHQAERGGCVRIAVGSRGRKERAKPHGLKFPNWHDVSFANPSIANERDAGSDSLSGSVGKANRRQDGRTTRRRIDQVFVSVPPFRVVPHGPKRPQTTRLVSRRPTCRGQGSLLRYAPFRGRDCERNALCGLESERSEATSAAANFWESTWFFCEWSRS